MLRCDDGHESWHFCPFRGRPIRNMTVKTISDWKLLYSLRTSPGVLICMFSRVASRVRMICSMRKLVKIDFNFEKKKFIQFDGGICYCRWPWNVADRLTFKYLKSEMEVKRMERPAWLSHSTNQRPPQFLFGRQIKNSRNFSFHYIINFQIKYLINF
jgi:hypothetical protein